MGSGSPVPEAALSLHLPSTPFCKRPFPHPPQNTKAVVERCGHELPPMHTLITMGGQHQVGSHAGFSN